MEARAKKLCCILLLLLGCRPAGTAQKWERVPDFEITRRMGAIAFSWKDKGYVGFGHDYNAAHPFNDISSYDPATGKWEEVAWIDSGFRTGAFCFVLGDDVYLGGGTRDSGRTALQDFYRYNLPGKQWTRLKPLPFKHAFGARAVVSRGIPYILGGCITNQCEPDVWQYNVAADTWRSTIPLPVRSQFAIAFVLNDEIYFGLGNGEMHGAHRGMWKLHPDSAAWSGIRSFTPYGRTLAVGVAIDSTHAVAGLGFRLADFLYQSRQSAIVVQGRNMHAGHAPRPETDFMMSDFWLYDARKDKWKKLPQQKMGRRGAISFVAGNYLYVGMGNAENMIAKDVYRLDLSRIRQ